MEQTGIWYIAQAIGFLAFGLGAFAFLQKRDRRMKIIMTGQGAVLALHYAMLGAQGGMVAAGVTTGRNFLSLFHKARPLAPLFLVIYITLGVYSYTIWYDALPIVASCIGTIALFYLQGIVMRLSLACGAILWLVHNIAAGSIGPTLMEIVNLGAHFTTIYRLSRENARSAESPAQE